MEPYLTSRWQDYVWSAGLATYLVLISALLVSYQRLGEDVPSAPVKNIPAKPSEPPTWRDMLLWLGLPAVASVALVSITNHICQDIPSRPFLWILPLSLYLLAFILAFDSPRWYVRGLWAPLLALAMMAVSVVAIGDKIQTNFIDKQEGLHAVFTSIEGLFIKQAASAKFDLDDYTDEAGVQITVALVALFCLSMVCLGETTRRKPPAGHLTLFYLLIAAGGVLGSGLVAIVCPLVLNRFYEFNALIIAGFVGAGAIMVTILNRLLFESKKGWQIAIAVTLCGLAVPVLLGGFYLTLAGQVRQTEEANAEDVYFRNFYGIATVQTRFVDGQPLYRFLYNGAINHGVQRLDEGFRDQPTTYYSGGAGVELAYHLLSREPVKLGVIGLGTGTMAAHARRPNDSVVFYEIDDKIIDIADRYFTYVADARARGATVRIDKGDARLTMKHRLKSTGPEKFDLLAIDAFSGDAIPVHLLTEEAMQLYLDHLSDRGVLAVHVSNRYVDLIPVVARLAVELKLPAVLVENSDRGGEQDAASDWILLTKNPEILEHELILVSGKRLSASQAGPLWTDSFSNLWEVMK
jgi:hypothetical protein